MRFTRAVCLVFIYNMYVIESLQTNKLKETEAKTPLKSDLEVNITIYPLRNEEGARNASVPARLTATPGDSRLKRQSVQYPPAGALGDTASMHTKSLYMFGQVLKGLLAAAISRKPFSVAGVSPAVRMVKGKVLDMIFPADSAVTNLFKWKLNKRE